MGDGGDVFGRDGFFTSHDLILFFGDVELVEPAEDLDLGAIFVGDLGAEAFGDGGGGEKVVGQEQLGLVVEGLKKIGQQRVIETASGENQMAINFSLGIRSGDGGGKPAIKEVVEAVEVGVRPQFLRQRAAADEFEQFRLGFLRGSRGEHPRLERMPAPGIQKAESGEAVEPGVGHSFDQPGAVVLRFLAEPLDLGLRGPQVGRVSREDIIKLPRDRLHELAANGGGEGFEG